jgi:peptidase E
MRDLYNVRLAHAMDALKALLSRTGDASLLAQERTAAMQALRDLDERYLVRVVAVHEQFDAAMRPAQRESLARQRQEIARDLAGCAGLAVAGGHVAVLLNRLRLLDVVELLGATEGGNGAGAALGRPVFAWSAGAMALGQRVVLFHDAPPQGPGNAEVFDRGLDLCSDILPLPHAWRRLRLDDPARVARFAQRFAPQRAMALEDGARLVWHHGRWTAGPGVVRLTPSGELLPQEGTCTP